MNRRDVLVVVAAGLSSVAGCLTLDDAASPATSSPSATRRTPTCTPSDGEFDRPHCLTMLDPPYREQTPGAPPTIEKLLDVNARVVVTGGTYYGSSSCDELGVETLALTDGELRIVVGPQSRGSGTRTRPCTADMDYSRYELIVDIADVTVDRVHVTERSAEGDPTHRTKTLAE